MRDGFLVDDGFDGSGFVGYVGTQRERAAVHWLIEFADRPSVRIERSAASALIAAIISSGRILVLLRSKMTSDGCFSRIRASTMSGLRSKKTGAPTAFAAVDILTEKSRSSTAQSTILSL